MMAGIDERIAQRIEYLVEMVRKLGLDEESPLDPELPGIPDWLQWAMPVLYDVIEASPWHVIEYGMSGDEYVVVLGWHETGSDSYSASIRLKNLGDGIEATVLRVTGDAVEKVESGPISSPSALYRFLDEAVLSTVGRGRQR